METPTLSLSFTHIKTPQLIGIICGCSVFIGTISAVLFLLVKSGTLSRFRDEMLSGAPLSLKTSKKEEIAPQYSMLPELYEHLLIAASQLALKPTISTIKGANLALRVLDLNTDCKRLLEASNGFAIYGESAYDPSRIWGWMSYIKNRSEKESEKNSEPSAIDNQWPIESEKMFKQNFENISDNDNHIVIIDNVTQKQIGMLSLVDNKPQDLSIRIDNLWITPSFQKRKYAHEAFFHILDNLFQSNYRRVSVEVDIRNIIMRKFLERCGFALESIMRKYRIVNRRNRDIAVYVVFNSDWEQVGIKLKRYLGIDLRAKMHRVGEIDESSIHVSGISENTKKKE